MSNNPSNVPPTKEYMRNMLQYGLLSDNDPEGKSWIGRSTIYVNSDAEQYGRNRSRIIRFLIKVAYGNRERIKSIPVLGKLALFIRNQLLKNKSSLRTVTVLDFSSILGLPVDEFIQGLYTRSLGRVPDAESFHKAKQAMLSGLPREGLIYLVCTSDEFANRISVLRIKEYQRIYSRYILRERIRRLPILGLPFQIKAMENQFASLTSAMEIANQNIVDANTKIDNTNKLLTEFLNKNKPVVYGIPGGVTVVQMEKFILGVPSEEWRLAKHLSQGETFEPGSEKYFCSIINDGMIVVDVGAYLGIYTLHALSAGCTVHSYESKVNTFKILSDNVGINGFGSTGRAHLYNLVVSDTDGETDLFGDGNFVFKRDEEHSDTRVQSVRLDTHLNHVDRIDIVKIDTEGAEPSVLRGMKRIIASNPHIKIIMEFASSSLKRGGTDPMKFIKVIHAMDLDIHVIDEISGEILDVNDEELCSAFSANILLDKSAFKM